MRISKKEKQKIIALLLPLLHKAFEPVIGTQMVKGKDLIAEGQIKDSSGRFIVSQRWYSNEKLTGNYEVNHERRLSRIIDGASDFQSMQTALAEYVIKYGLNTPPEETTVPE